MVRLSIVVVVVAACTQTPAPTCPEPVRPVEAAAPSAPAAAAPELDDPAVVSQSHAFLDAYDKADVATFQALIGPTFVNFQSARFFDAPYFVKGMQARLDSKGPARSRTCKDERVFRTTGVVVYVGACVEQFPAFNDQPATTFEGWETLVWTPVGGAWKVAHWQWQKGGLELERDEFNETYRKSLGFKQTPNQLLVETVRGRRPGAALDVGMGQGRNAIYLASQRWRVTGIDIADEGIRIAKETAAQQKLKLVTVQQDVDKYEFGTARWDLVTLIYAGDDAKLIQRIKPGIKRGGLFIAEYFHDDATQGTGMGGFATGELAKLFEGWKILRDEVVEDVADWSLRKTKLVRFVAEKR